MRSRFPASFVLLLFFSHTGFGQIPSVQIKVRESSGFLGLGGPRIVEFRLSNESRSLPLNSVNINAGSYVYFDCVPAGNWQFDEDFTREYLSTIAIEQNGLVLNPGYVGQVVTEGDTTHVLLGYPKTLRVDQLFFVRFSSRDSKSEVEFRLPQEFWPGYESLSRRIADADEALAQGRDRGAIAIYNEIIANGAFNIFSRQQDVKTKLLSTFDAYLTAQLSAVAALRDSVQLDLKERIGRVAGYRPALAYVVDSLPQLPFEVPALDSTVSVLRNRAKSGVLLVGSVADSLQTTLDEQTVRWILRGSVTGRKGLQYQGMIQALAYAFASADFSDSSSSSLAVTIPPQVQKRLAKDTLLESFQTFVRICAERRAMRLTLFPVEFLPNLRKDSAFFALPYFSMLKAVSDYFAGNFTSCRNEIRSVFRSCFAQDLLGRFDSLRLAAVWRQAGVDTDALALIHDAERLESANNPAGAEEKYRQAVARAPGFALATFALGEFYARSADSARATAAFQQAYQADTVYLSAYLRCAQLFAGGRDFRSAINVLTLALARGNDFWVTNFLMGQAFVGVKDPVSAEARFARALELNPRSYETYIAIGKAYQASRDFQKARDYFNRALEVDALRREAVDALNALNEQVLNVR